MNPLVSILLPTYNQRQYVAEAIQSCLSQTWPAIEIVIGDDASTDGTWDVIAPLAAANPDRINAVRNAHNLGVSANCNQLLAKMSGKYIALFAGDDLMYPGKIQRQVEFLERNPDFALCAHDMDIFQADSAVPVGRWLDKAPPYSGGVGLLFERLCFMSGCSVMGRRECMPKTGYIEALVASDWLMFVEMLLHTDQKIHTMNEVYGAYRRRPGQLTSNGPHGLSHTMDHAFACGYLYARYPDHAGKIAECLLKWKQQIVHRMQTDAVWIPGVGEPQLNAPRWLFHRLIQSIRNRLKL